MCVPRVLTAFLGIALSLGCNAAASAQLFGDWQHPVSAESVPGTSSEFNTAFNDGCPYLSPDGLSFYMASNRPGGMGGIDIWAAYRNSPSQPFGAPVNLPAPVNGVADDFCPTHVLDKGLFFVSTRDGGFGGADIYLTVEEGGVWSDPENLGSNINSPGGEASPSYFEDQNGNSYLHFSSNREGGFEPGGTDSDIYVSVNFGPAQLAPGVNTASDDVRPNVRWDGREIVFDSNRAAGVGGFDIWTASRNGIGDAWQSPTNLMSINSTANETRASLSWDGSTLVFGSNRAGSEGQSDIYFASRAVVPEPTSGVLFTIGGLWLIRRSRGRSSKSAATDSSNVGIPMVKRTRRFLIGTSILLLAGVQWSQAAEFSIVSPSDYEHWEGEESVGEDCCSPFHYMQVFPAEDFAALGNQPHWLEHFTVRPDQRVTSPRTVHFPDTEFRLSTTQKGPDNLSFRFDDNHGPDVMQFYRGPLNWAADAQSPGPGPREFYHAEFPAGVTPYLYNPSQGHLLFEAIARGGESPSSLGDKVPGIRSALYAEPSRATQGSWVDASIFQFTFVPMLPGDFNGDGDLTHVDIDLLSAHVQSSSGDLNFDLNGDRIVDTADRDLWVQDSKFANTFFGDADLDGSVDFPDFLTLSAGYGKPGGWAAGDFDGNGQVNFPDFLNLSANFGYSRAVGAAVPEPSSVILLLIGLVAFGARLRPKVV